MVKGHPHKERPVNRSPGEDPTEGNFEQKRKEIKRVRRLTSNNPYRQAIYRFEQIHSRKPVSHLELYRGKSRAQVIEMEIARIEILRITGHNIPSWRKNDIINQTLKALKLL